MFRKNIAGIRQAQTILVAAQKTIKSEIKAVEKKLEKYIQQRWDATFPGFKVHFLHGLDCGCMTGQWKPEVFFYEVNDIPFCSGKWYAYDEDFKFTKIVKPPIPTKRLRRFLEELTKEIGIKCRLVNTRYAKELVQL